MIAGLAARQHGVVSRRQLIELSVTHGQIRLRLKNGRLHELHRGVYLVGHAVPPRYAPEMAALLACGTHAVLSHTTAASLWNLLPYPARGLVCITIPPGQTRKRPGLRIHRSKLHRRDVRHHHGLTLTSPPRTLLGLASELGPEDLEHLVAEAHYRHLASEDELRDQLYRNPHKPGVANLRRVLDLPGGPRRTRSPGERAMLRLLRRAGIAGFETNARVAGYEVDFLWRRERLIVEVDGFDGHSGRAAFERDRLKVSTLIARAHRVMLVTGRQIRNDPDGVLARPAEARS